MGIPTVILLTTVSLCVMGQLTRDPELSTTEGRMSYLDDTCVRLESCGTSMRTEMAVIEETNDGRYEFLQEQIAALEAHHETEFRAAEERINALEATNNIQSDEINALKTDIEELNVQLMEHAATNAAQSDEINALKTDIEELNVQPMEHAVGLSCSETFDLISSPEYGVPDSSLTASSEPYGARIVSFSRLNSSSCWVGDRNQPPIWIKVDFGQDRIVESITTRGFYSGFYVRRYTISTSRDGVNWTNIQEDGNDVVFDGNSNDEFNTIVANLLPVPMKTRFVRLNPVEWLGANPGLRWAVVGCPV